MTKSEARSEGSQQTEGAPSMAGSRVSAFDVARHVALFIAFVTLYTLTLNGDVQPADSGEFQIAAITLGVPHPPGYPLFTLLGWLFAQVPIGSPFARVSFLSVVAAAATLVLVSLTVGQVLDRGRRPTSRPLALLVASSGLLAALALGTSTTFWAQATTTNVRSLTAFFTALMLYASARIHSAGRASALVLFGVAFGLGVGHHVSLIFVGVVLGAHALYATWRSLDGTEERRRHFWRVVASASIAFAATQLVWLYLPIRDAAGARFAPGNLTTPDGLFFHIFARGFAGDMLAFATPEFLFDRLALVPTLLTFQFSVPVLAGMAIALVALVWQHQPPGLTWLLAGAVHLFITVTYRAPQTVEYAMPCWVIACVALGSGLGVVGWPPAPESRTRSSFIVRLSALVLTCATLAFVLRDAAQRWPSFLYLSRDRSTRAAAEAVLDAVRPGSVVLAQWHQATPMWALQDVEGLRRDVRVEYVFPRGAQPYAETFAEQAKLYARARTTYVTSLFADELAANALRAMPLPCGLDGLNGRPAWRVADRFDSPAEGAGSLFDGRIAVVGQAEPIGQATCPNAVSAEVGQAVAVDVGWHLRAAAQAGDSITVRILRPDGRLAANADVRLPPDAQAGDYEVRRVILGIPLDLEPGTYPVYVGAYRPAGDGFVQYLDERGVAFVSFAQLEIAPASFPPATQRPIGDAWGQVAQQPQLIGVDYDTGVPGGLRVWTHWRLGRSAVSVTLADADGRPLAPARQVHAATTSDRPQYLSLTFDIAPARAIRILPFDQRLPDYREGQRYVPFADQIALIGSSAHGDASLKVDLHWLSLRPLVNDYIVSMRIEGNGLYRTHDGVPVLGAVPTLKWIRDSRVTDRHPFELGEYRGPLRGSVVIYDSVNQLPLPPLDERYQNGITIPLP